MNKFRPHINPVYPPNNFLIFEEWFATNYNGCNTDRELLPIFPTSYWVNNNYGNDQRARTELQYFVDGLDPLKKYFIICQYDDGCMLDWKGKDVLEFNMSKTNGVMMPLICMPHPYKFHSPKKWFANFVGGKTHPLRIAANELGFTEGYYCSNDIHDIETYCRILHESIFTLCFRGYGLNSFRMCEALQYGSIPVYISDEFINTWDADYNDYAILIKSGDVGMIDKILSAIEPIDVVRKQEKGQEIYEKYYTYGANYILIKKHLETEYNSRQEKGKATRTDETNGLPNNVYRF